MAESLSSKYKVPANLRPLLEAFARETLRTQPADLIEFGRTFFETLQMAQKSNPNADIIGEERLYYEFRTSLQRRIAPDSGKTSQRPGTIPPSGQNLPPLNLNSSRQTSQPQSQVSSNRMQPPAGNSRPTSPEAAAKKIQAVYRGHYVRNHPEKFGLDTVEFNRRRSNDNMLDNKKDMKRHSVGGYTLENDSPDNRAATKIQAEIRGYLARKHVQALKEKNVEAATKIQAHIRGFLTRKNLNKDSPSRSSHHSNEEELVH